MTFIHPTAVVSPHAQLGEDVQIGPWALIEGDVTLGNRCVIESHAVLKGRVQLGDDNLIGHGAVIGGDPQHTTFKKETPSGVRIGHRNRIREHCTINRAATEHADTVVGDDNYLMAVAHLGHDTVMGNHNVLANNVMVAGHVHIADRVFLGGGSMFHQFMSVGSLVIAQGGSGFSKNIPPYCIGAEVNVLAGLNSIGLRRAGMSTEVRKELREAYRLMFQSGRNVSQALEEAAGRNWSAEAGVFFDFIRSSGKRGVCPHQSTPSFE